MTYVVIVRGKLPLRLMDQELLRSTEKKVEKLLAVLMAVSSTRCLYAIHSKLLFQCNRIDSDG